MSDELHLFPLRTVLFPGGRLELRIFERRYLDLVTDCLRNERPFGVCLIQEGEEAGAPARPHAVGTAAHIIDWDQRSDGLLGITVEGFQRFEIVARQTPSGVAQRAQVRWLAEAPATPLSTELQPLADLLARILDQIGGLYGSMPRALTDAGWVSARLSELLPIPTEAKQQLLEIDAPEERLELLRQALDAEAPRGDN
ncbi:MAG: LON peptidase substrate-binding domain-containing protein [Halorhodospira sp.]